MIDRRALFLAGSLLLAGCATVSPEPVANGLDNTEWVLIGVQEGSQDADIKEVPLYKYTMHLNAAGPAQFKFDCNNGTSSWEATPQEPGKGNLAFGKIATTMMLCGGESIGEKLAADLAGVRRYSIYDGKLSLLPEAEGRIYVWDAVD